MSDRAKVIGLSVAAILIGLAWLLVHMLGNASRPWDHLMSGRTMRPYRGSIPLTLVRKSFGFSRSVIPAKAGTH